MTETIKLMKAHTSVRRFKEQVLPKEDLTEILTAAQMASPWKNFQSYSVIVVRSQEKKDALYELVPQEAIRQSAVFLLFVGDLNRAEKGARLHTDSFQPQGVEGLLISSVDAALAGQNALLSLITRKVKVARAVAQESATRCFFGLVLFVIMINSPSS